MAQQIKFGTDGWRGIIADDFTFGNVRRVAQATAQYMKTRSNDPLAIVSYDCRFASEDFAQAVSDVFASNGIKTLVFDRPSPLRSRHGPSSTARRPERSRSQPVTTPTSSTATSTRLRPAAPCRRR